MKSCMAIVFGTAAIAAFAAAASAAEQTATDAEEAAFQAVEKAAARRVARPRSRDELPTYRQALISKCKDTIAAADAFLPAYPQSKHAVKVKFRKAYALATLGSLTRNKDNAEAAKAIFSELTAAESAEIASQSHLMLAYLLQARAPAQAIEHAQKAADTADNDTIATTALYTLANLQERAGQNEQAKATYKKLIESYPTARIALIAKGKLARLNIKGSELTDLKFTATDGTQVDIADYKGKVVLVDFWATWCGPCVGELPNVLAAYKKHHPAGFEIIGISLDRDRAKLDAFVKEKGMTWPQYFDGKGWQNAIARKYGINSIPATFLLDRKGVVREVGLRGSRLEQKVDELLKEQ